MNSRIEELQQIIKDAQVEMENIRKECKHDHQHEGIWSWREGSYQPATICSDCGSCVKIHGMGSGAVITTIRNMSDGNGRRKV